MGRDPQEKVVATRRNKTHDVDHVAMGQHSITGGGGTMGERASKVSPVRANTWNNSIQDVDPMPKVGTNVQECVGGKLGGLGPMHEGMV